MESKNWFRKAVIYQVFIDRFFGFEQTVNVPEFLGGNLAGVTQKIDYLLKLGINVIWLSPFYETEKYHGYHITDFKKVDPHFGNEDDLKELIKKANDKGIRVVADFVPNHCSKEHPFFKEAIKNVDSKYQKWFVFEKWPDDYLCFLDFKELPKLNLKNKEVEDYIIEIADYWLSLGLTGLRIDHIIGPSHAFWKKFGHAINERHPQAILFGEAWVKGIKKSHFKTITVRNKLLRKILGISQEKIQLEYHNEIDGVLDFVLNDILIDSAKKGIDFHSDKRVKRKIRKHLKKIPSDYFMVTFLDNHDMDRFLRHCKGDINTLLSAFELLLSLDYPIVIYNGTENCVYNEIAVSDKVKNSDLYVRNPFEWDNINQDFIEGLNSLIKKYRKN